MQEFEQTAIPHELGDDVDRLLHRTDGVKLNKLSVAQLLHDLSFGEEVLGVHGAGLEGLDGDRCGIVPQALPDLTELALAELPHELEAGFVDLPLVPGTVTQSLGYGFLHLQRNKRHRGARPDKSIHVTSLLASLFYSLMFCSTGAENCDL